jgi:tetratricopeptide (TPR) repeat protein
MISIESYRHLLANEGVSSRLGMKTVGREGPVSGPPPAMHRAIVCVDVEGFGDRRRTNQHQVIVREALYDLMRAAFDRSEVPWDQCYREDRGDGLLILVPPEIPKSLLVAPVLHKLAAVLAEHNSTHDAETRIRLRMAVHAGEIIQDSHGVAGTALNMAFRLLEAEPLKTELRRSVGALAVITSQWFFDEVIRNDPACSPDTYEQVQILVKETRTSAWIRHLGDSSPAQGQTVMSSTSPTVVPRQLPGKIAGFVGRNAELDALTEMLLGTIGDSGTVVLSAVDGTAGIGKTAIAIHWAHNVADRFPDGQLYVNLRGFDPAGQPLASGDAVRNFLDALGVPSEQIPVSLDAQAALYRSLLADRRVLVLLDNARDSAQVRPLLPGSAGCVTLITSRIRLTGLVAAEGARPLTVDLLPAADARQLLARRIGLGRVEAEPGAVNEIIAMCARLPLALSIVAARAASYPTFPMTAIAAELRDAQGSLEAFSDTDIAADLRAVFSWSYQRLSIRAARLFRLLGLNPGTVIGVPAAASLAALPLSQTRNLLIELSNAHLIERKAPERFSFHDLLRAYAAELANTHELDIERREAIHRVLDYYLYTAHAAARFLHPRMDLSFTRSRITGVVTRTFTGSGTAWDWFETEYPVFMDAIRLAAAERLVNCAWQLPVVLEEYLDRRGHRHDCLTSQLTALAAAQHLKDRHGQAYAHYGLGRAFHWDGRFEEAESHLDQALALAADLTEVALGAHAYVELSHVFEHKGQLADALDHARRALALAQAAGSRRAELRALFFTGKYHAFLGKYREALSFYKRALKLTREIDDRRSEGYMLNVIGYAYRGLGEYDRAIACYKQALALQSEPADRYSQAVTFNDLGDTYWAAAHDEAARQAWKQALDVLENFGNAHIGHVRAEQIRIKLDSHDGIVKNGLDQPVMRRAVIILRASKVCSHAAWRARTGGQAGSTS